MVFCATWQQLSQLHRPGPRGYAPIHVAALNGFADMIKYGLYMRNSILARFPPEYFVRAIRCMFMQLLELNERNLVQAAA